MTNKLSAMTLGYLEAALWSTSDYSDESNNPEMLDANFSISDISDEFKEQASKDCAELYKKIADLLTDDDNRGNFNREQIGHDFWLTRNRHGAGFWDGDYVNGDAITKIVQDNYKENSDALNEAIKREE